MDIYFLFVAQSLGQAKDFLVQFCKFIYKAITTGTIHLYQKVIY